MKRLWILLFLVTMPLLGGSLKGEAKSIPLNSDTFPDDFFMTYAEYNFDTNEDGKLSDKERKAVTEIDVSELSEYRIDLEYPAPYTLEGIEYFPNLTKLSCSESYIRYLDVSKNKNLVELDCSYCNLTKLDLRKNKKLKKLYCSSNNLKKLDVSKNTKLEVLFCDENKLKQISLSKNNKLKKLLVSRNSLKKLNVKNLSKLEALYCGENKLKKLDVTHNKKLRALECDTNEITKLNVTKNKSLDYLYVGDNALRELDLSKNTLLQTFCCNGNQLLTGNVKISRTQLERCEAENQKATIKIKKIGKYYYIPLVNVLGTNVISNLSYGKLTRKGIRVKKSTLPKTITYEYNMFTDGDEKTKVTIQTKK